MLISLKYRGDEKILDVPDGMTIAEAGEAEDLRLMGSCGGQDICAGCAFKVRGGMEHLLKKDGTPHVHPTGYAAYVKTCQVSPADEGVSIDADDRARRW